jgi:transposase
MSATKATGSASVAPPTAPKPSASSRRQLVAWLVRCGITTVALEATGAYGHVRFLTLLEAGFDVVVTSPKFTKQIQGRPKTDKRDCQWIQRLHSLGLLPPIFQPDDATHTLHDYVRQRGNLVRLSGQHIQRMQKALELMNLKLTTVLEDLSGQTGLRIVKAGGLSGQDVGGLASPRVPVVAGDLVPVRGSQAGEQYGRRL